MKKLLPWVLGLIVVGAVAVVLFSFGYSHRGTPLLVDRQRAEIAAAMERYNFDHKTYPRGTAAEIATALSPYHAGSTLRTNSRGEFVDPTNHAFEISFDSDGYPDIRALLPE